MTPAEVVAQNVDGIVELVEQGTNFRGAAHLRGRASASRRLQVPTWPRNRRRRASPRSKPATDAVSPNFPGWVDRSGDLGDDPDAVAGILLVEGWVGGSPPTSSSTATDDQPLCELVQQQLHAVGNGVQVTQLTEAQVAANERTGDRGAARGNLSRPDVNGLRFTAPCWPSFHDTREDRILNPSPSPSSSRSPLVVRGLHAARVVDTGHGPGVH